MDSQASVRLDHIYVSVKDMDRAVRFYENLLGMNVAHREQNQWADFDLGNGCYLGLIDPTIISSKRLVGNNQIISFALGAPRKVVRGGLRSVHWLTENDQDNLVVFSFGNGATTEPTESSGVA